MECRDQLTKSEKIYDCAVDDEVCSLIEKRKLKAELRVMQVSSKVSAIKCSETKSNFVVTKIPI